MSARFVEPTYREQPAHESKPQLRENKTFKHAVAFVLGFSLVFIVLGVSVGVLGRFVPRILTIVQFVGGILLVLFGLVFMGIVGWVRDRIQAVGSLKGSTLGGWLVAALEFAMRLIYSDQRARWRPVRRGYTSSFATGVVFSAGWAPCLGPLLAAILLLVSEQATVVQGTSLLVVYTAGLAIPFLVTGAALGRMSGLLRRLNQHVRLVSIVSGLFLVLIGWLLLSDRLLDLSTNLVFLFGFGFGLEETLLGAATISYPLAFLAGVLSFFSPCVLPLVPAYLGYMSGTTVLETSGSS